MKLHYLEDLLKNKHLKIFSTRDLTILLRISEVAAQRLLWRYEKKNYIIKLKRGLYSLSNYQPSNFLIANILYQPSYISFDTAMSYHGIIPETIYSVTSASTKTSRSFTVGGIKYDYHKIKKIAYSGYKLIKYLQDTVLMAEGEKALADYLYFIDIGQRDLHYERMNLHKINQTKLIKYARLYKRPKMFDLIKKIYAYNRKPARIY